MGPCSPALLCEDAWRECVLCQLDGSLCLLMMHLNIRCLTPLSRTACTAAVGASGWPSNTLLYMGVHPTSPVTRDALVSRFGLMLVTKPLSEQEFGATLKELHNWHFDKPAEDVPPEALAKAAEWAKQNFGELTVRAAWRYLERVAGPQA